MGDGHEKTANQPPRLDGAPPRSALESALGHIARSSAAGAAGDGGRPTFSSSFQAEFYALCEWGESNSIIRKPDDFLFFHRPPDAIGHEHEVWFNESAGRWFKATHPTNHFGLAWGKSGSATVGEYLTRLALQNTHFNDKIDLVALLGVRGGARLLISQPHIAGGSATATEINDWFIGLGFVRMNCDGFIAWYRKQENLLVADAHEGNVIRTPKGELVPIDLNITKPKGELFDWANSDHAA